jgi:hypothetical protein
MLTGCSDRAADAAAGVGDDGCFALEREFVGSHGIRKRALTPIFGYVSWKRSSERAVTS